MFKNINKDPINTLKKLTTDEIVNILENADNAFFNTDETLFSDDIYDIIKAYLKKIDPKNIYFKKVGAEIKINKEKLPYYMGSLDKIKDNENEILKWKKKYLGSYIISEKLDGISCLIYYDNDKINIYTRGNGYEGQNITHILPYLNLDLSKFKKKIAIRGELIISREKWKEISKLGANARNIVAGAIHSKKINQDIIKNIEFIAYDILYPRQNISTSYEIIQSLGIPLVTHIKISYDELNLELLSNLLQEWRKKSKFEIDGIVIYHDEEHKIISGKNPKYAFAFKTILTHEKAEVIVNDVEWNISKHRYLKPLVKFNEINLSGVKIKKATGFNAAFIKNNNIGPGSHIIIVRSGDVIPHIVTVLSSSSTGQPKMPDLEYKWTDSNIDIYLSGNEKNKEQDIQVFTHFMKTLNIDGIKEGVLSKLYQNGYDSLHKIINISIDDLTKIGGFKEKSAQKIYLALQEIKQTECNKLLSASNVFGRGFGEKKIDLILSEYPFIANNKKKALELNINDIIKIKGIAKITAEQFITNLPKFYKFYEELDIKCINKNNSSIIIKQEDINKNIYNKKFVFSGFRNKDYNKIIIDYGGSISDSISKNIDILVVKNISENTTKINKAKELGISIISKEEFENKFILPIS